MDSEESIVAVEIGGTSINVCIIPASFEVKSLIENPDNLKEMKAFDTTDQPEANISEVCAWVKERTQKVRKVLISNFGPLNLNPNSDGYGTVLNTPKPGWKFFSVVNSFCSNMGISKDQVIIDSDVGCAAYLEYAFGSHNVDSIAYITIGTGVGIGVVCNKKIVHGLQHPEGGHIPVKRHVRDTFSGICPIHQDCLEGLITNNAIKSRKNLSSVKDCKSLNDDDEIWEFISYYIAQACLTLLYLYSIERIVIGGGIINREILLEKIGVNFIQLNNDYIQHELFTKEKIAGYINRTQFKNFSGILSAFALESMENK